MKHFSQRAKHTVWYAPWHPPLHQAWQYFLYTQGSNLPKTSVSLDQFNFYSCVEDFSWLRREHEATDTIMTNCWDDCVLLTTHTLCDTCLQEMQKDTNLFMSWIKLSCVLNMLAWMIASPCAWLTFNETRRWLHHHKACCSSSIHPASHFGSQALLPTITLLDCRWEEKRKTYFVVTDETR